MNVGPRLTLMAVSESPKYSQAKTLASRKVMYNGLWLTGGGECFLKNATTWKVEPHCLLFSLHVIDSRA